MYKVFSRFFILFSVLCIFAYAIGCGSSSTSTDDDDDGTGGDAGGGGGTEEVIEAEGTDEGDEFFEIGVAPTITKFVDSDDTELSDNPAENTTRLSAKTTNKYTVTFSETMNPESLTSENFYLFCDGTEQSMASIEAATNGEDDIENNEWVITMDDQLPQYAECTLTFGEEITDMDNFNLEEVTYVWNTLCASSTEFGSEGAFEACWTTVNIPSGATLSYGSLIMNFTPVNSSTDADMPFIYKLVNGDFEVVLYVSSRNSDEGTEEIGIMVSTEEPGLWINSVHVGLYYSAGFGDENVYSNEYDTSTAQSIATATTFTGTDLYLKMKREDAIYTTSRSTDGKTWTQDAQFTDVAQIHDVASLGIYGATGNTNGDFSVTIDSFTFESGNAVDQD